MFLSLNLSQITMQRRVSGPHSLATPRHVTAARHSAVRVAVAKIRNAPSTLRLLALADALLGVAGPAGDGSRRGGRDAADAEILPDGHLPGRRETRCQLVGGGSPAALIVCGALEESLEKVKNIGICGI